MYQKIKLGSTPWDEECAQAGTDNYAQRSYHECHAYAEQLYRVLKANGHPADSLPKSFSLIVSANAHDFGTYYEVACRFDAEDDASIDLAFWLENNAPANWDAEARKRLGL